MLDKRYIRLLEDISWLKSDISGLVRLKAFNVARVQMKRLKRYLFFKCYAENLGFYPSWIDDLRRIY